MQVVEEDRTAVVHDEGAVDPWWLAALVVLALGVAVHAVGAVRGGWVPSGDDGFWSIMSRSVFSSSPPLLGSSSSGGVTTGEAFHHLGPLGFYLLAPFVWLFGSIGVALGAAVLNAASVVVAAVAARSGVGRRAGWFVLLGGALLCFTMGSELLVDPWNPHLATLPLWCGLACAWAVLCGRPAWAAPGLFALSLSLQTHLSFVVVAGAVAAVTLVACGYWCRRAALVPGARAAVAWAPCSWAVGVALLANSVTLIQQFFGPGPGNLTAAIGGSAGQDDPIGLVDGARALSQPFLSPLNWLPGSWRPQAVPVVELAPWWIAVVVVVLAAVLCALALRRRRWQDAVVAGFALALCLAGWFATSRTAIRSIGVPLTLVRWAWPTALFVQLTLLETALRLWPLPARVERRLTAASPWPSVVALVLTVGLVGANLPARDEGSGAKAEYREAINEVLEPATDRIAAIGRPMIELSWNVLAAETAVAIMDRLDARGLPFSVDDPVVIRQAGERHRPDGSEDLTVTTAGGAGVLDGPAEGFERIAETMPLSPAEIDWYLEQRALVEERLPGFVERLMADDTFAADVPLAADTRLDPEMFWVHTLCGKYRRILSGSATVERELVDDATRDRLCELDGRLERGAVAVDIGPPPV